MKRIITIIATTIVLFFTSAKSQTINDFFQKYSSDDRFEAVNVGKSMLDMAKSSSQGMDKDQQALIENINGVRVLTSKVATDEAFTNELIAEFKAVVEKENMEPLVEVREKGQIVKVYSHSDNDKVSDLLIFVKEADKLNIVWVSGSLSRAMIDKMKDKAQGKFSLPFGN